jgi:putative transposase
MKILKAYKFRLKPTEDQVAMLKQHGGNSRFVWNKLLEYAEEVKKNTGKYPSQSVLQTKIIQIKASNEFIKISYSQPIQVNAMRLNKAYTRAFSPEVVAERNKKITKAHLVQDEEKKAKALAKALKCGLPKFKRKSDNSDSIFYPQHTIVKKSRIHFPKLGWINYNKHREMEGKILFVTITQDGNQYYVSITCEVELKEKVKLELDKANIAGIDVGLKKFAVLSDKTVIENPRTLKKHLRVLRRESRKLSRMVNKETGEKTSYGKNIKKSSNNRNKQIVTVQKLHRKVRNIRRNFLHQTTHYIIDKYDGVVLENLDIKELLQKGSKAMNRSISDASWYEFTRQLAYKSIWNSKYFVVVDQYFASTQICSCCGSIAHLSLKDRVYACSNCGAVLDRDYNASINLKNEGIRILKENISTVGTTGIQACGSTSVEVGEKQEKRRFQVPAMALA